MATIKDIAERAGVSRGTVDRVLNNRGRVAPEKEALIRRIAKELDYSPNILGKSLSLRNKKTNFVFLHLNPEYFPYVNGIIAGAKKASEKLAEYGVSVEYMAFDSNQTHEEVINELLIPYLDTHQVDGLVLDGLKADALIKMFTEIKREIPPIMTFDIPHTHEGPIGYVGCDYEQLGLLASALLKMISAGAGKIAIVSYEVYLLNSDRSSIKTIKQEFNAFNYQEESFKEFYIPLGKLEPDKAKKIASDIVNDPEIKVVYFMNPSDYSIITYLEELDTKHRVRVLVNDLSNDLSKQMMEKGVIDLAICNELEMQGFNSLGHLFDVAAMGVDNKYIVDKTKLNIVLKENMDTAN